MKDQEREERKDNKWSILSWLLRFVGNWGLVLLGLSEEPGIVHLRIGGQCPSPQGVVSKLSSYLRL